MLQILLLSDTHGWIDPQLIEHFEQSDEVWHAGDIGSLDLLHRIQKQSSSVRSVYGNIDDASIRRETERDLYWEMEGLSIFMTHIGGYPPKYNKRSRSRLDEFQPDLYICGHSHILKVVPDEKRGLLHINPGAAGYIGIHKVRTAVRFQLTNGKIQNLEVLELGPRGKTDIES